MKSSALKDRQIHFMQGVDGVGYEKAKAIVEYYGGLPFDVVGDLTNVPGIGNGLREKIEGVVKHEYK